MRPLLSRARAAMVRRFLTGPVLGASPSGKAVDFDSTIRRFESSRPSQDYQAISGAFLASRSFILNRLRALIPNGSFRLVRKSMRVAAGIRASVRLAQPAYDSRVRCADSARPLAFRKLGLLTLGHAAVATSIKSEGRRAARSPCACAGRSSASPRTKTASPCHGELSRTPASSRSTWWRLTPKAELPPHSQQTRRRSRPVVCFRIQFALVLPATVPRTTRRPLRPLPAEP